MYSFISKRRALFEQLVIFLTTKYLEGLRASQLACMWWLFRKATFASTVALLLQMNPFFKSSGSFVIAN
ncbi:hypothetical protein EJD97_024116 [Solanum chilense]|uniref:Uncharacterized protein n=1 Tax=Solanum chilense TaxID=4083 RepID=A0A6N2AT74_SOLCI|nr:hypothetical protein EJD97_024116 [Solanum chilense]